MAATNSAPNSATNNPHAFDIRQAAALALGVLVLHIVTNIITPYEFHRDEFLYFAMGDHLRLWRMDFPPFIAIVARVSRALFGDSLTGLRLAPAVSHAALVACASWAAFAFGGRRSAQALAALAVALSPLFMRPGALFQPVTFDQLWWTMALIGVIMRIRDDHPKHWLGVGVFLGLGALTKFSIAFLSVGMAVAVLVTPLRRDLLTRYPWIGVAVAILIGHPSISGQVALGWPVRSQMRDLQVTQLARVGLFDFLSGQLFAGPIVLVAAVGVLWIFFPHWFRPAAETATASTRAAAASAVPTSNDAKHASALAPTHDWRPIGIATGVAFLLLLFTRGKAYYIGPIYPVLAGAGAVGLYRLGERLAPRRPTKVLALVAASAALFGLATLPYGLPLLAPNDMSRFGALFGAQRANTTNTGEQLALPQDYADMLGWEALVDTTARVWRDLPPADSGQAVLIATNYGRAGALDLLGRAQGLPRVISAAGSYWFFGPGDRSGNTAVVVGDDAEALGKFFGEVTEVAHTSNAWGVPEEQVVRVFICRKPVRSLQEMWPNLAGQN